MKENKIHLVLLDIMMPNIDGLEVCRKIRKTSNIPIIMLSAKAADMDKIIGFGRIIGDKTIFLYIQDIMVIPEYQNKHIGTQIMNKLISQINVYKQINPNIRTYLGASKGMEPFYEKFGFISRPNNDLGAGMILY